MNKHEVREAVLSGKVTLGLLRKALMEPRNVESWRVSYVNKGMRKYQALDIFKAAIGDDWRPDDTKMSESSRDILIATNIVREVGLKALL